MTATNHALTGAAIGLVAGRPELALPLALVSHFICDALPHFGTGLADKKVFKSKAFRNYLWVEAGVCLGIVMLLAWLHPLNWLLAAICAFVAASPDLVSYARFKAVRSNKSYRFNVYTQFAKQIQWFERPVGALVEVAWFVAVVAILVPFLR